MNHRLSPEQWSDYWQAGSITTFMGRFAQNYDGEIREFWHRVFEALPSGARIVDLATGNGALALLASQFSVDHDRGFEVTGVDFAATDPKETLEQQELGPALDSINFLTSTRIEATGLPDAEFDLVCSQFGFEYAALDAAVAEVVRLLDKDTGVFAAMLHVESSVLLQQAREGVRQDMLCRKSGLLAAVKKLLRALEKVRELGEDPGKDERCEKLRHEINRITGKLHSAQSQYQDPGQLAYYLKSVMAMFDPAFVEGLSSEEKIRRIDAIDAESQQYAERMRDLMASALSDDDMASLRRQLEKAGLAVDLSKKIELEGQLFCQAMVVVRQ